MTVARGPEATIAAAAEDGRDGTRDVARCREDDFSVFVVVVASSALLWWEGRRGLVVVFYLDAIVLERGGSFGGCRRFVEVGGFAVSEGASRLGSWNEAVGARLWFDSGHLWEREAEAGMLLWQSLNGRGFEAVCRSWIMYHRAGDLVI